MGRLNKYDLHVVQTLFEKKKWEELRFADSFKTETDTYVL